MTMPDPGAPVGHHDATASNDTRRGPPAVPHDPDYGDTPNTLYTGFLSPHAAAPMPPQPVYSPMAGYAIQQHAPWMPAPQHLGIQQQPRQHPHHHENRAAGLASANWLAPFPTHIPTDPSTPTIASAASYMMAPAFAAYPAPSLADTPAMQLAQEQALHLGSGSGVMQHTYSYLSPDHQMMSMAAAMNTQHPHQPMQAMVPQQAMDGLDNGQLPASTATPPWPSAQDQFFYYSPFGFGDARTSSVGYTQAMEALPNMPHVSFSDAAQQPVYLSNIMAASGIPSIVHPQMQQYPAPATSFTHAIDDDQPNEARRKFVRTNGGTGGLFANRSSAVNVHGYGHATPMATAERARDQGTASAATLPGMTMPETPEHNPAPLGSSEAHMPDDADAMCISPPRKRSLSAACGEDWSDPAGAKEPALKKALTTVPENSLLHAKETHVSARQEMQFVHMDAAEILMSSNALSPDDNESGAPIKSVKFRPAGNAPIKVRKWSTVVHPPPPESGYGSMPREVDFDHSASNVFLQHQASPVAPSSITSKFIAAPPSMGKGKAKQDDTGSPSTQPVRTLNWRPSDDRISARSTASAGLPPKTAARTARLEEKKKAAAAEEVKTAKAADSTHLPDADADEDADADTVEPLSVAKALAELSTKRGRPALTSRIARTKQVRKRAEDSASKPDTKAAKVAKAAKQAKAAAKPTSGNTAPKG